MQGDMIESLMLMSTDRTWHHDCDLKISTDILSSRVYHVFLCLSSTVLGSCSQGVEGNSFVICAFWNNTRVSTYKFIHVHHYECMIFEIPE